MPNVRENGNVPNSSAFVPPFSIPLNDKQAGEALSKGALLDFLLAQNVGNGCQSVGSGRTGEPQFSNFPAFEGLRVLLLVFFSRSEKCIVVVS